MRNTCKVCGYNESQVIADAKALGLQQEFERGIYSCCQITEWADEQWLAWFEAIQADEERLDRLTLPPEPGQAENVFVPARLRRPQVPWYRNPDDLS
jgi:hypothetical protein